MKQKQSDRFLVILWMRSLLVEAFFVILSLLSRPLAFFPSREQKGNGPPILLVHGYLHNSSAWVYLKWYLQRQGFGPVFDINLGSPFSSIEDHAKKMKDRCDEIAEKTQSKQLIVIGHSMGGLVASVYALSLADRSKKIDIITIGSPLHGTYLGYLGLGKNVVQMRYQSPFVLDLKEKILQQNQVRFFHILSHTDQIVVPFHSACIEGKNHKNKVFNDLGHISLLFSPRVAKTVSQYLNELTHNRLQSQFEPKDLEG